MTSDHPFDAWREAVGFGRRFPRLRALRNPLPRRDDHGHEVATDDSRRFFVNQAHRDALRKVYESLGTSRVILVSPGHGATTLTRLVHQMAERDSLIRRSIPVLVSFEDLLKPSYEQLLDTSAAHLKELHGDALPHRQFLQSSRIEEAADQADEWAEEYFGPITSRAVKETVESQFRLAIVESLLFKPWELRVPPALCRDLLGAPTSSEEDLEARRRLLRPMFEHQRTSPDGFKRGRSLDEFWGHFEELAPTLAGDYQQTIRELNSEGHVRISLVLDLSPTPIGRFYMGDPPATGSPQGRGEYLTRPYRDAVKNVTKALKNIEEESAGKPRPALPSLIDKTYFLCGAAWRELSEAFQAQPDEDRVIDFPSYRPVDVFAMLAYHYPPTHDPNTGRLVEVMAAVVDSAFMEITERSAISTEMILVEEQLRHQIETDRQIRYHRQSPNARNATETARELNAAGFEPRAVARQLEFVRALQALGTRRDVSEDLAELIRELSMSSEEEGQGR